MIDEIAQQAYVYGFPLVDFYRILFGYCIYPASPAYAGPFNAIHNTARVYTPTDTTVQTPNSDTPYSFVGLDLRAEPLVLTLPAIEKDRYYSVQFVDQYTFNVDYVGTRTTGNGGGKFLIAGPDWKGAAPAGIDKVIRFDTQFGLALVRTQLFGPDDLDKVKAVQAGYAIEPLSSYSKTAAPPASPAVNWPAPLTPDQERSSPQFFNLLAFILASCPTPPNEEALRTQFASIGIEAGKPFDAGANVDAYLAGMAAGQKQIDVARAAVKSAQGLFGTPEAMQGKYLERAVAAQYGILGNTAEEAMYLGYADTPDGRPLTGANAYTLTFAKDALPPANAFWSVTLYELPQQLLVANPLDRYLINSPMLPGMKRDADGGLTLYIQHASPGKDREANWLPAPAGPFFMVLRVYYPKQSVLDGSWQQPPMVAAKS